METFSTPGDASRKQQRLLLGLIQLALVGWGVYHMVGAIRSAVDWRTGLIKAGIIFACLLVYLGVWFIALGSRARRQQRGADRKKPI